MPYCRKDSENAVKSGIWVRHTPSRILVLRYFVWVNRLCQPGFSAFGEQAGMRNQANQGQVLQVLQVLHYVS
jgi:hypothetical protein